MQRRWFTLLSVCYADEMVTATGFFLPTIIVPDLWKYYTLPTYSVVFLSMFMYVMFRVPAVVARWFTYLNS